MNFSNVLLLLDLLYHMTVVLIFKNFQGAQVMKFSNEFSLVKSAAYNCNADDDI